MSLVGSLVEGRYLIEEELGGGGMSAVHTARDLKGFGRKVVVKTLLDESRGNEYIVKKFRQEAEALYRVEHPNVVNVLSYGELPDGHPYLVLQFIEGSSLRELVHEGNVELDRCARIIREIGSALTAAHEKGILHRDLKPENVMLQPVGDGEEQVKVIDFGIAKIKDSVIAQETVVVSTAGTIAYMSPEQLGGREITPASDVYALGVIAYELITGRKPFNVDSPFQLPDAQRAGVSVRPVQLRPDLPPAAEEAILKALAYEPQNRYARTREFGDRLYEAITGLPAKGTGLLPRGMTGQLHPATSPLHTTPMLDARVTENQTLLRVDTAPESPVAKGPGATTALPQQESQQQQPSQQQPSQVSAPSPTPAPPQQTVHEIAPPSPPQQLSPDLLPQQPSQPPTQQPLTPYQPPQQPPQHFTQPPPQQQQPPSLQTQRLDQPYQPQQQFQQQPQAQPQQQPQQAQFQRQSQQQPLPQSSQAYAARESIAQQKRGGKGWLIPLVAVAVLLLVAAAAGLGWWFLRPQPATVETDTPTVGTTRRPAAPAAKAENVLAYWLTVQKVHGGKEYDQPFQSLGSEVFENGWEFRLSFASPKDGYLYVLNEGKDEKGNAVLNMLFPNTATNSLSARLAANQTLETPPGGYFELSGHPETEKVWLVWSSRPVEAIEGVKEAAWSAASGGEIKDAAQAASVRDLLSKYDASKVSAEKDSARKQMNVRGGDDPLVHLVELEHH